MAMLYIPSYVDRKVAAVACESPEHTTEHFTISDPYHPSTDISEPSTVRLSSDFIAQKLRNVRSGSWRTTSNQ